MTSSRAEKTKRRTRIQAEKEKQILEAALDIFSIYGLRGTTLDQIADAAGLSKPNLLYYFSTKEAIHRTLLDSLLETWLDPINAIDSEGDPLEEISSYIQRKLEMSRDLPRESKLFAIEILQGTPYIHDRLEGTRKVVDEKVNVIRKWSREGKIAQVDPYHLIFSIWATTQHYADFNAQIELFLGCKPEGSCRFEKAGSYLQHLFMAGLKP